MFTRWGNSAKVKWVRNESFIFEHFSGVSQSQIFCVHLMFHIRNIPVYWTTCYAVCFQVIYFFRYDEVKFVLKRQTARKKGFTPVTTINIRRPVSLPPLNSFKNLYSGILNNEECSELELQSEKSPSAKKGLKWCEFALQWTSERREL